MDRGISGRLLIIVLALPALIVCAALVFLLVFCIDGVGPSTCNRGFEWLGLGITAEDFRNVTNPMFSVFLIAMFVSMALKALLKNRRNNKTEHNEGEQGRTE